MESAQVDAILAATGFLAEGPDVSPTYTCIDGSEAKVERKVEMNGGVVADTDPLIVQVSRWDRLKDPVGVMQGFADHVAPVIGGRLVLAGPAVAEVADDPEGLEVLNETRSAWASLPEATRDRVHLVSIPMDDGQENAAIVNALQRKADIIVQKSLAEGFGLTVAEGMWKARPVVASRIGGIQDQIEDGRSGLLIDDPQDLKAYGAALVSLLSDPDKARIIGETARERVRDEFLGPRHLMQYLELIARLLSNRS
jgi:trehalose synthase